MRLPRLLMCRQKDAVKTNAILVGHQEVAGRLMLAQAVRLLHRASLTRKRTRADAATLGPSLMPLRKERYRYHGHRDVTDLTASPPRTNATFFQFRQIMHECKKIHSMEDSWLLQ